MVKVGAVAVLGIAVASFLLFRDSDSSSDIAIGNAKDAAIHSEASSSDSIADARNADAESEPMRVSGADPASEVKDASQESARGVLQSFFGDEAGPIIAYLESKGWDLDSLGPPTVTWDEARAELIKRLLPESESEPARKELHVGWPEKLSADWLDRYFRRDLGLDEARLAEVRSIAQPFLERVEPLYVEYKRGLEAELLGKWSRGDYYHAPYTSWRPTTRQHTTIFAKADGHEGWAYSFTLTREDAPWLDELSRQMTAIVQERDAALMKFMKGH